MTHKEATAARRILPLVNAKGQIVSWRCSGCSWTSALGHSFMGLAVPREIKEAFNHHLCNEHNPRREDDNGNRGAECI